ncbi:hypothetical protein BMF94_2439 [Rhodotorula taiwanensis]|uniref:Uncharacterized protein n=1 Tax=Rhodotorula taiwanensis TaxID=741276 RepID=A0A2S5BD31_9BASI|nr:hypothetical protein BMF94_2439 [Rhodotorula taiwanensis]
MSRYNGPPRHRPEPLALGAGPYSIQSQQYPQQQYQQQYHNRYQQPLHSAPLPNMSQHAYAPLQPSRLQSNPQTAAALAEFQQAQQVYLAELNRTIEHQIAVQQQVEREAALRLLSIQQQQRELYGLQQGPASAGLPNCGHGQQHDQAFLRQESQYQQQQQHQHSSLAQQANPLVASALARRQRQDAAAHGFPQQTSHYRDQRGYDQAPHQFQHRTTPSPPAVILSAPGEPYPDTSSSGSDSGETRPTSPESSVVQAAPKRDEVKASRRRSHLDALTHTVEHAEQRRRRRPVSIAGPADLPNGQQQATRGLQPRWPGQATGHGLGGPLAPRAVSDPLLSPRTPNYRHGSTPPSSASSATTLTPSNAALGPPTARTGPPPVPGTASAIRQPRGPPTDLDAAQTNFAQRIRARAIGSLKVRSGRNSDDADQPAPLAAGLAGLRVD